MKTFFWLAPRGFCQTTPSSNPRALPLNAVSQQPRHRAGRLSLTRPGGTRPPRPGVGAQGPALPPPQPPPLELPEGCRGPAAGVQVAYRVRLRMLSCPCQPHAARTLRLPRTLLLSGAAYDLAFVSRTRLGRGPNRTWHIPAAERPGAGSRARGAAWASSRFGLRAAAAQAAGFCK